MRTPDKVIAEMLGAQAYQIAMLIAENDALRAENAKLKENQGAPGDSAER